MSAEPAAATEKRAELTTEELIRYFRVLSHDLKSPIFSIDGFSELLQVDYADKLDEEGADFLRRIRSSVVQLKRVLDDMSRMVKLLSREDQVEPVSIGEIVEELRLRFNYLIEDGEVDFEVADGLPSVRGDREKIREALAALISNALIFTDRPKGQRRVSLEIEETDRGFCIYVADNGIGIDPRYLHQVFELGMQLDKSRGAGAGYGLYLARRVAESQGGSLTAESIPGEGSRFCLTLPS